MTPTFVRSDPLDEPVGGPVEDGPEAVDDQRLVPSSDRAQPRHGRAVGTTGTTLRGWTSRMSSANSRLSTIHSLTITIDQRTFEHREDLGKRAPT